MQFNRREVMLLLGTAAAGGAYASTEPRDPPRQTLALGWHDEFNSLEGWSPWTAGGGADIVGCMDGFLRVTLGKTSQFLPEYSHYRAGVWKEFDVDLHRYSVLAVRTLHFQKGASWDVQVFEYRAKDAPDARDTARGGGPPSPGNAQKLAADMVVNSSGRYRAETIFVDVQENFRRKPGKSRVRLLLNLSGPQQGALVDYAWARFIRREDVEPLRNNPTSHGVDLVEP